MRVISPAVGVSVDQWLEHAPQLKTLAHSILCQREAGTRPMPSETLIDKSKTLTAQQRTMLLDRVAALVDENCCGRSEMCLQFATLLQKALTHLGLTSRIAIGTATYFNQQGKKLFTWEHAWVRIGSEVIDGNVDCLYENPAVPQTVQVNPYWGPIAETPKDRQLRENRNVSGIAQDEDVEQLWWPDLRSWVKSQITAERN